MAAKKTRTSADKTTTKRSETGSSQGGSASKRASGRPKLRSSHAGANGEGRGEAGARPRAAGAKRRASGAAPTGRSGRSVDEARPASKTARKAVSRTGGERLAVVKAAAGVLGATRPKKAKGPAQAAPPTSVASEAARELATLIAIAALDKKAAGLEILDVAGKVDYADFLVIMTGRSDRQVAALANGIEEALRKKGKRAISVEGMPQATWVLMDFGDVVVHVFQDEARGLYDIEGLWMDAKRVALPDGADGPTKGAD